MTITAVSVVVALIVGGLETLNLIGDELGLTEGGGFWGAIGAIRLVVGFKRIAQTADFDSDDAVALGVEILRAIQQQF